MLGPLPTLYKVVVSIAAMVVFAVGGTWAAHVIPLPLLLSAGTGVGLALGAVCAYLLVHQTDANAQPQHIRRRSLD